MPPKRDALTKAQTPHVVFQPHTYRGMQQGINTLVEAIKPTLGPRPRTVALERMPRTQAPELVDKGALIARRITDLADPDADMGAMLLRQMLWKQYEVVGDGTAVSAVLFQSLFNDGVKYITAGGNAMQLGTYLVEGLRSVLVCLSQQKATLQGREQIRQVALTLSQDSQIAETLSEVFEVLGEYARVDIRSGHGRALEREYVQGTYWEGGVHTQELILDSITKKTDLEHCTLFVSDLEFDDPRTLLPIITAASSRSRALVIVASKLTERAIGLLTHINKNPQRFQVIAVKTPANQVARVHMLEDLSRLTGARTYLQVTQDDVQNIQPQHLGSAQRVWANKDYFCIVEDADEGQRRTTCLTDLYQRYQHASDDDQRAILRERIGGVQGASATLLVGGLIRSDIDVRKEEIKGIVASLRGCLEQGVVPGGGIALLNCQSLLRQQLKHARNTDEQAALKMLARALEMPLRHILANAGVEAGDIIGQIQASPTGHGYDVTTGCIRSMHEAGIVDSAAVTTSALERAVRTAALALTVDVLVHHRNPEVSAHP